MRSTGPLFVALLAAAATAQELRWTLPPHGGAVYRREWQPKVTMEPADAPNWIEALQSAGGSVVLADELDDKAQRLAEPPASLRDFVAAVALDLSLLGGKNAKARLLVPGRMRVQPAHADLTWAAPRETEEQTLELALQPVPLERGVVPGDQRQPKTSGRIAITRSLDRAAGRVRSFEARYDLSLEWSAFERDPAHKARVEAVERWTFVQTIAHGDAAFRTMVGEGIRKATAALRGEIDRLVGLPAKGGGDEHFYTAPGELALTLLALVKGGEDPRDPQLQKGYADLRRRSIEGTYSLACAILAIEALYTPPSEAEELRAGRLKAPMPRQPSEADRALLAEWTKALLDNLDRNVDAQSVRRWWYGPGADFDNSNTQYALLGLYAAQLCGVEIPANVWVAAANHWLAVRITAGEAGAPALVTHADLERAQQQPKAGRTRAAGAKVPCVGWSYKRDGEPTGSMTCAGVSGLALCAAALRTAKKGGPKLLREIDDAMRGGLLWLQRNVSVRRNPGPEFAWTSWYHYYLYGLERACELNQVAMLGETDWYFDGAMQLLVQQTADGRWGGTAETCFGLLFLKKTALPAITR